MNKPMNQYIKLSKAPTIYFQSPVCNVCAIYVESDGDQWVCPCCGTSWSFGATDGDVGDLCDEWDDLPDPPFPLTWHG